MSYRYNYDPIALKEYKEAISWYQEQNEKAVDGFILEIKEKINRICNTPSHYKGIYKTTRETLIKKFPYTSVYEVD